MSYTVGVLLILQPCYIMSTQFPREDNQRQYGHTQDRAYERHFSSIEKVKIGSTVRMASRITDKQNPRIISTYSLQCRL